MTNHGKTMALVRSKIIHREKIKWTAADPALPETADFSSSKQSVDKILLSSDLRSRSTRSPHTGQIFPEQTSPVNPKIFGNFHKLLFFLKGSAAGFALKLVYVDYPFLAKNSWG